MVAPQIVPERVPFCDHVTSSLYCIDWPIGPDRCPINRLIASLKHALQVFYPVFRLRYSHTPLRLYHAVPYPLYLRKYILLPCRRSQHDSPRLLFGVHLANVYRDSHSPGFPLVRQFAHLCASWNGNTLQNHRIGHPISLPHSKPSDVGSVASLFKKVDSLKYTCSARQY
jgi:hypothetical protein